MNNTTAAVYAWFADFLNTRLSTGAFTTEDSVRYCLFLALLEVGGVAPEQLLLEYPHPVIKGAEIDTWIAKTDSTPGFAAEFK
jgi:hypothetical protein